MLSQNRFKGFFAALILPIVSNVAIAGVIGISGDVAQIGTPHLEYSSQVSFTASDSIMQAAGASVFVERANYIVPNFPAGYLLQYEAAIPGTLAFPTSSLEFSTGTRLNSYILHFGMPGTASHAAGSITFDQEIVGFMTHFGERPVVEAEFQLPGLDLISASGLELNSSDDLSIYDMVSLSADRRTITFDFNVDGASDDLRIFTDVPEPSTLLLFLLGAVVLVKNSGVSSIKLRKLVVVLLIGSCSALLTAPVFAGPGRGGHSHATGYGKKMSHGVKGYSHGRTGFKSRHSSQYTKFRAYRPSASSDHLVSSYYRRDGTFIQAFHATNPDTTRNNNYSTLGNVNPYTGRLGTKPRDGQ